MTQPTSNTHLLCTTLFQPASSLAMTVQQMQLLPQQVDQVHTKYTRYGIWLQYQLTCKPTVILQEIIIVVFLKV